MKLSKQRVFDTLDLIENKTKIMAHENYYLGENLSAWQDGTLKDSYFQETLNKYLDLLNSKEKTQVFINKSVADNLDMPEECFELNGEIVTPKLNGIDFTQFMCKNKLKFNRLSELCLDDDKKIGIAISFSK